MGSGKKVSLLVGSTERTRLADWCQGDLGEKNVVETLVMGDKMQRYNQRLQDDLFYRVTPTFLSFIGAYSMVL